jgi:hypothetical protein
VRVSLSFSVQQGTHHIPQTAPSCTAAIVPATFATACDVTMVSSCIEPTACEPVRWVCAARATAPPADSARVRLCAWPHAKGQLRGGLSRQLRGGLSVLGPCVVAHVSVQAARNVHAISVTTIQMSVSNVSAGLSRCATDTARVRTSTVLWRISCGFALRPHQCSAVKCLSQTLSLSHVHPRTRTFYQPHLASLCTRPRTASMPRSELRHVLAQPRQVRGLQAGLSRLGRGALPFELPNRRKHCQRPLRAGPVQQRVTFGWCCGE